MKVQHIEANLFAGREKHESASLRFPLSIQRMIICLFAFVCLNRVRHTTKLPRLNLIPNAKPQP